MNLPSGSSRRKEAHSIPTRPPGKRSEPRYLGCYVSWVGSRPQCASGSWRSELSMNLSSSSRSRRQEDHSSRRARRDKDQRNGSSLVTCLRPVGETGPASAPRLDWLTRGQCLLFFWTLCLVLASAQTWAQSSSRFEFTRLVAHWSDYGNPEYLTFIDDVQPDVAQVGFYGAHFWSLVHTPQYSGYPAHFPRRGIAEASAWFADLNRNLHQRGVKVVGHFNVEFLIGDPDSPEGARGFFRFYRDLWDENMLGPRPEKDPVAFLEKNHDGTPISDKTYAIGGMKEYWACLRNPSWQKVLKAWIRRGIDLGLDGFIANY